MSTHIVEKISSIFRKKANAPGVADTPTAKDGRTAHVCQLPEASTPPNNKELEANLNELKQLKKIIAQNQKEIDQIKTEIKNYKTLSPMDEERKRAIDKLIEGSEAINAESEKAFKMLKERIKERRKILIKNNTQKIYLH